VSSPADPSRRPRRGPPPARDAWAATSLVLVGALRAPLNLAASGGLVLWPSLLLGGVELGTLAWRRVAPEWVLGVTTLATVLALTGPRYPLTGIGVMLAAYAVGAHRPSVRAGMAAAIGAAVHATCGLIAGAAGAGSGLVVTFLDVPLGDVRAVLLASLASYGIPTLIGAFTRVRRELVVELRERVSRAERERDAAAQRAASEERARIARELHDVAAHDLSAIVVQAGAADRLVGSDDAAVRRTLAAIRSQGRDTLAAMRAIVGVLRDDDGEGRAPQPQLADVDRLVAAARAAGATVDVDRAVRPSVTRGAHGAAVELAAFRVAQEALANARQHAPGAPVALTIRDDGREIRIRVTNAVFDGCRPSGRDGHGLLGMRERVQQVGGRLRAGPEAGTWVVDARVPRDPNERGSPSGPNERAREGAS
jgi:signal transduction histidine kinase